MLPMSLTRTRKSWSVSGLGEAQESPKSQSYLHNAEYQEFTVAQSFVPTLDKLRNLCGEDDASEREIMLVMGGALRVNTRFHIDERSMEKLKAGKTTIYRLMAQSLRSQLMEMSVDDIAQLLQDETIQEVVDDTAQQGEVNLVQAVANACEARGVSFIEAPEEEIEGMWAWRCGDTASAESQVGYVEAVLDAADTLEITEEEIGAQVQALRSKLGQRPTAPRG